MSLDLPHDSLLLDHIFEDAQTLYALLDPNFNFIRVNRAYANSDSKAPLYFIGKNHFSLFPNTDNEEIFAECLKSGNAYYAYAKSFDYEYNPERGTTYWDWSLQPVKDNDGKVTSLLLSLIDVSKRIHAEQLLHKAQEVANIGTWNWDIKNDHLEWTDEIYRIFDKSREEFGATYEHFIEAVHPDDRQFVRDSVANCFNNPSHKYAIEHRIVFENGEIRHIEEQGMLYRDIDDIPSRMIGIVHDITERKNSQIAIQQHKDNLEKLVAEKTQRLVDAQEELLRSEKLATLGRITATIGHEIRNPLATIRSMLYLLKKMELPYNDRMEKIVTTSERNIDRCDQIIDELLTFSRTSKLDKQVIHLHDWLNALIAEYKLPDKLIVDTLFEAQTDLVSVDPSRLRRAINNVIDNSLAALHANKQDHALRVDARLSIQTTSDTNALWLSISDNGCGIPENIATKIMEPLFSTKSFGVGLGMGIIDQIVKDHGGELKIESRENEGTRVSLCLPLVDQAGTSS